MVQRISIKFKGVLNSFVDSVDLDAAFVAAVVLLANRVLEEFPAFGFYDDFVGLGLHVLGVEEDVDVGGVGADALEEDDDKAEGDSEVPDHLLGSGDLELALVVLDVVVEEEVGGECASVVELEVGTGCVEA